MSERNPGGLPFRVAVVGHANTGKTSLLRTLLRDPGFGEVGDGPTTRTVESAVLLADGRPAVELVDTPGLEDSIGFLETLDEHGKQEGRAGDPPAALASFVRTADCTGTGPFVQEAAAVRQVLEAEAALYVVDARDRVLGRHRDELVVLARCAKPVVPVLNFTASPGADPAAWRTQLARAGLHAAVSFDTFLYDDEGERRLYEALAALLEPRREVLERVVDDRRRERASLLRAAALLVAELLVDAAAAVSVVELAGREDDAGRDQAIESFRERVRRREDRCVRDLLALFRFGDAEVEAEGLELADGRWGLDLFGREAMRRLGIEAGGGAAAGAAAGLALDVALAGVSLGTAALAGAVIGGLAGGARKRSRRLLERLRGRRELRCDDVTLELLARREGGLVRTLLHRGHAALGPIRATGDRDEVRTAVMLGRDERRILDRARQEPGWSRLDPAASGEEPAVRARSVRELADRLEAALGRPSAAEGMGATARSGSSGP